MIKKFLENRKKMKASIKQHKETVKFYETLKMGAMVLEYIHKDLKNNKNRAERRRMEHTLKKEGKFSEEIIAHYKGQFDKILIYLHHTNPVQQKPKKVKQTIKKEQPVNEK